MLSPIRENMLYEYLAISTIFKVQSLFIGHIPYATYHKLSVKAKPTFLVHSSRIESAKALNYMQVLILDIITYTALNGNLMRLNEDTCLWIME